MLAIYWIIFIFRVPELEITRPLYESESPQLPDIVITALYNENGKAFLFLFVFALESNEITLFPFVYWQGIPLPLSHVYIISRVKFFLFSLATYIVT